MFSRVKYMNQNIQWTRSTSFDGLTGVIDCVQFGPTLKEKVFFSKITVESNLTSVSPKRVSLRVDKRAKCY